MSKSASTRSKGQVNFEFLVVLAIMLLFTSIILIDFFAESSKTLIFVSVKDAANQQVSLKQTQSGCENTLLRKMSAEGNTITLSMKGCVISAEAIADKVERDFCGIKPNSNDIVECGDERYGVKVTGYGLP